MVLGLFLGLVGTRASLQAQSLDFFCSKTALSYLTVDKAVGTWEQSLVFTPIDLATIPQILLHV